MAAHAPSAPVAYTLTDEPRRGPGRALLGALALLTIVALTTLIVLVCANRPSPLTPSSNPNWYPTWLTGPFGGALPMLTHNGKILEDIFTFALLAMFAAYLLAIAYVPSLRARWAIGAIAAVHIVLFLSPPLSLTDVFNYINYGRMEVVYHLNPYATIPTLEPHNDLAFVLSNWHELQSPYGPLFTLLTFAIVPLGVAGAFWAMKGILVVASLATLYLVWRCAELLGRDPVRAIVFVGLNPVVLVFGLGGDHNDFITVFFVMLGVYLLLLGRRSLDGVAVGGPEEELGRPDGSGHAAPLAGTRRAWLPAAVGEALIGLRERAATLTHARRVGRAASGAVVGAASDAVVGAAGRGLVASGVGSAPSAVLGAPTRAAGPAVRRRRWVQPRDRTAAREHLRAWVWPLAPVEITAGASLVVAAGMKASAAVLVPVALCALRSSPRRVVQALIGVAVAAVIVAAATYTAFGMHLPDLSTQGRLVTNESLPNVLGFAIGLGGETQGLQHVMQAVLVLAIGAASLFAWRRHELLRPSAWATLALLVTLSWVLPWYILWLLPLVALARSRLLVGLSLTLALYLLVVWVPLAGGWYRAIGFDPGSTKIGLEHAYEVKLLLNY